MATAATIKKNIAKLEAALKSKATPKSLKSKLEAQLVKSKAELSGINKGSKPKTSTTKSTQTALQKLKEMVNKNKKLKTYKKSGVDLEKDADRPALPIGRRTAKQSGKTYYEYRANRIDVKQPPKRYPKLEKGGYFAKGGVVGTYELMPFISTGGKGFVTPKYDARVTFEGTKDDAIEKANSMLSSEILRVEVSKVNPKATNVFNRTKKIAEVYEKGGYMAKGGKTKSAKESWNDMSIKERMDFLKVEYKDKLTNDELLSKRLEMESKKDWDDLAVKIQMEFEKRSGYMAKGGEAKEGYIQQVVEIATKAHENGIKASDMSFDEFNEKVFKIDYTIYAIEYMRGAYQAMKNKGYAKGGYMAMGGEMHRNEDKLFASGGSVDPEKYPELQKIADKIADETAEKINQEVRDVKSNMPYKAQWVLEEVVKDLTNRI